jgi:hypothetical protein
MRTCGNNRNNNMKMLFALTNRHLDAHDIIVDDDFDITDIIDFDGVMAAPIDLVSQLPILTGLIGSAPGDVLTHPLAIEHMKAVAHQPEQYRN